MEFKGHDPLGVQVCAGTDNMLIATKKKGSTANVKVIPELFSALQKAESAAGKAGLLGKEAGASPQKRGGYRPGAGRKKKSDAEKLTSADESTSDSL